MLQLDKFIDPSNLESLSENDKNEISSIKNKIEELKVVTAEKLRELLVENMQYSSGTKGELLVRAADVIVRGVIPKCSKCKNGILYWSEATQDYFCKGYSEEEEKNFVKCDAIFPKAEIQRTPCVIPETFWQKKERKRKTVTVLEEKGEQEKNRFEEKEEEEDEEPEDGMRKRRKSAGVRRWDKDFIYEKDDSADNLGEDSDEQYNQQEHEEDEDYEQDQELERELENENETDLKDSSIPQNNRVPNLQQNYIQQPPQQHFNHQPTMQQPIQQIPHQQQQPSNYFSTVINYGFTPTPNNYNNDYYQNPN